MGLCFPQGKQRPWHSIPFFLEFLKMKFTFLMYPQHASNSIPSPKRTFPGVTGILKRYFKVHHGEMSKFFPEAAISSRCGTSDWCLWHWNATPATNCIYALCFVPLWTERRKFCGTKVVVWSLPIVLLKCSETLAVKATLQSEGK